MADAMMIMNEDRLRAPHKPADVVPFLEAYIAKKEEEIAEIEQMVGRYEERRLKEERAYQSMSSLRKLLSGKKPTHHLAVEYIHYIKKPMERVRLLRLEIERARELRDSSAPAATKLSELESFR
jgi:hypothetical protein